MNIRRSRKWLIIGILLMSVLSVGCSGPSIKKLPRDDDTAFDKESKVNESTFSEKETRDLAKLAKVWGVVKYYHSEAIAGEINMDYELFRVMSSILEEDADVNLVLLNWAQSLGEIEASVEEKNNVDEETIQMKHRLKE